MRNAYQPFSSWGIVLILLGLGIVMCLADNWNDQPIDYTQPHHPREVLR